MPYFQTIREYEQPSFGEQFATSFARGMAGNIQKWDYQQQQKKRQMANIEIVKLTRKAQSEDWSSDKYYEEVMAVPDYVETQAWKQLQQNIMSGVAQSSFEQPNYQVKMVDGVPYKFNPVTGELESYESFEKEKAPYVDWTGQLGAMGGYEVDTVRGKPGQQPTVTYKKKEPPEQVTPIQDVLKQFGGTDNFDVSGITIDEEGKYNISIKPKEKEEEKQSIDKTIKQFEDKGLAVDKVVIGDNGKLSVTATRPEKPKTETTATKPVDPNKQAQLIKHWQAILDTAEEQYSAIQSSLSNQDDKTRADLNQLQTQIDLARQKIQELTIQAASSPEDVLQRQLKNMSVTLGYPEKVTQQPNVPMQKPDEVQQLINPVEQQGTATPKTKAEYDALPSGTVYIAPDGSKRRKP